MTDMHAEAVEAFLAANGMPPSEVGVVGFHGQTVLHRPERRLSVQLGDGPRACRPPWHRGVYDFRAADIAAGGQGAPMVPIFHRAMVRMLKRPHPVAVLNVGGVANVTFIDGDELVAFDVGPGNALIDDFLRLRTGQPQDDDGRCAAGGRVDEEAVERILSHPFFSRPAPKSLDRNAFRHWVAEEGGLTGKSTEDGAATLDRDHGSGSRALDQGFASRAGELDCGWRRNAQSDLDADAGGAIVTRADRDRRRCRMVSRGAGGPGFRLSGHASC